MLNAELAHLDKAELDLKETSDTILALRMLYISLQLPAKSSSYLSFLKDMDPCLFKVLTPMDVLYFWQTAGKIQPGQHWMAVIAIDEVSLVLHKGC